MILATYQPINPQPGDKHPAISKVLGYAPIWCVSAETMEDFLCQSYFCAPNFGEELIIFETDEYDTIDKCKWYNAIRTGYIEVEPSWINSECKFKEYMVKEIDNVIFRTPMDFRNRSLKMVDFEEINPVLEQICRHVGEEQENIQLFNKNNRPVRKSPQEYPKLFQVYKQINIERGLLSILYSLMVKHDPLDFVRFRGNTHSLPPIHTKYIDWVEKDCTEEKLSSIVNDFYGLFDKSIEVFHRRIQGKIGRNEPCPCGSGKKWKKCCGRS